MTIAGNEHIYSVSELTRTISMLLEAKFPAIWVEGEISNLKTASSGHIYFSVKDAESQLAVVMFKAQAKRSRVELKDGLKIRVLGGVAVYKARGQYQLIATKIQPVGVGELQQAFEALKKKLYEKGLFDENHKKPVPLFPRRIGIVTSATGAAIRDILNVLERRFYNLHIIINPVRVQGIEAPPEITRAIKEFNRLNNVDVIIVTRGGGSIEDLWAFNDEKVACAIYDSDIPVISAVGHEIDWTISDFVADLRVPTPSAAAELVIGSKDELKDRIQQLRLRLSEAVQHMLERYRTRIAQMRTHYIFQQPHNFVRQHQLRIDELAGRICSRIVHQLEIERHKIEALARQLNASNPTAVLGRGYSLTTSVFDGKIITDVVNVKKGDSVKTRLKKGNFTSTVE